MTAKIATLPSAAMAEWRAQIERDNAAELWAYKVQFDFSIEALARHFGCSVASMNRYLDEQRPVPGYIVSAIRGGKVAA